MLTADGLLLLRIICTQVGLHSTMTGVRLAAPLLALSQGFSAVSVGLLVALTATAQFILALPAGRAADRHGLRRPIDVAAALAVAGSLIAMFLPVFAALCVAVALTGAATCISMIAIQRHVGRVARSGTELRQMFSWLSVAPAAANFIGPIGAGLLIDHGGSEPGDPTSYRLCFAALAIVALLSWLLARNVAEPKIEAATPGPAKAGAWGLLRLPGMPRLLFLNWVQSSGWDIHSFAIPLIGHEKGIAASVIGILLGCFGCAVALVRAFLSRIAGKASDGTILRVSFVGALIAFACYPFLASPWSMAVCSIVLGLALGATQPVVMTVLHEITPPARRGQMLALRMMLLNGSSMAMPMLIGSIGTLFGVATVFFIGAGTSMLATLVSGSGRLGSRPPPD